ncbi:hypothetical protein TW89_0090 [Neisseria flavescens]|nr:hypothetical protein TW89_0090 [Neisseria flavescens]
MKIDLIAKGRLKTFQTAYGACIYLLQTVFCHDLSDSQTL